MMRSISIHYIIWRLQKKRVISEEKTKELQKDWQGYGAMTVAYSLVVIIIVLIAIIAKLYF